MHSVDNWFASGICFALEGTYNSGDTIECEKTSLMTCNDLKKLEE